MKKAIYPGSFDPVTLGHLDIIERSSKLADTLIIGVLTNHMKTPWFSIDERIAMLKHTAKHLQNVEILSFDGLLVDFAKEQGASTIIRGLRAITDFEYELQLAQTNRVMASEVDTIFLTTSLNYSYLSSSVVREIGRFGGDLTPFLPPYVIDCMKQKIELKSKESNL